MYSYTDELVDILYMNFIIIFSIDKCIAEWPLMSNFLQ